MTDQKEKQKEVANPRVEQHGMCEIQHSPLHRMISVNDLIGGNVSRNAHISTDLVASHEMSEWRSLTLDLSIVFTVESKFWLQNTRVGHNPLHFCNSLRQLLIIDLIFTESQNNLG